jgi:hypothetical protein
MNADIIKSNKRWLGGIALFTTVVGIVLLYISLSQPILPPVLILSILNFYVSGLFTGTYLIYRAKSL